MTILSLLAIAIGELTNTESALVRNLGLNAKAEALADAGIHRTLASLLESGSVTSQIAYTSSSGKVQVSIADEDGKVDINAVRPDALTRLLVGLELPPASARRITDAIIDYRDTDDDRRTAGAERPEYLAAGREQGPKNSAFEATEELLLVLGIDRDLYQRLQPAVTVMTGSAAFDPRVAPQEALHALPPSISSWAERLVGFRLTEPLSVALPSDPSVTSTRQQYFTLRSEACLRPQKARFVREAIVKLDRKFSHRPFQTIEWKRMLLSNKQPSFCDASSS